jgi:hypothetical protein
MPADPAIDEGGVVPQQQLEGFVLAPGQRTAAELKAVTRVAGDATKEVLRLLLATPDNLGQ